VSITAGKDVIALTLKDKSAITGVASMLTLGFVNVGAVPGDVIVVAEIVPAAASI